MVISTLSWPAGRAELAFELGGVDRDGGVELVFVLDANAVFLGGHRRIGVFARAAALSQHLHLATLVAHRHDALVLLSLQRAPIGRWPLYDQRLGLTRAH